MLRIHFESVSPLHKKHKSMREKRKKKKRKRRQTAVLRMDVHGGTGAPCRVHRHCAFSSIEHSSRRCDPQLAIIFGRVSAGPEETHEGRQACIHTYEHPYEGCARKEGKKRESKTSYCEFTSTASFPLPRRRASGCIFYRRSSDLIVMLLHLFYHFFNF